MRFTIAAAAGAALLTLSACGGGGEGGENSSAAQNELNAFNQMDAAETNGAIPDEIEGNTPADNRNLKTGEPGPADANAAAAEPAAPPPAADNGQVESNVSGM